MHLLGPPVHPLAAAHFFVLFCLTRLHALVDHAAALRQVEAEENGHADALLAAPVLCTVHSAHISIISIVPNIKEPLLSVLWALYTKTTRKKTYKSLVILCR